jgi:hypothetical protein
MRYDILENQVLASDFMVVSIKTCPFLHYLTSKKTYG